jgi:LEA14-like dessication related protein
MCRLPPIRYRSALLAAVLALLAGCQSMQDLMGGVPKPSARVIGTSIRGISLENIVLLFDVEVENPYAASLPLADLRYSLASTGTTFLEGTVQPTGAIPARGKQVIQLPATVKFASLFSALKGVKPGAVVPYTADFRIGVDTPVLGRIDVPLSKKGELPVPAVPEVEVSSLVIEKLGLDEIKGSAKLHVRNTNRFALDLSKLGVSLALAGKDVGVSRLNQPLSLAAGESTTVEVPLSFSPRAVGVGLINLLKGNQIAYEVSGSVDANSRFGALSLPFRHIGNSAVTKQ